MAKQGSAIINIPPVLQTYLLAGGYPVKEGPLDRAMEIYLDEVGPADLTIGKSEDWFSDCLALASLQIEYARLLSRIWNATWGIVGKENKFEELTVNEDPLCDEFESIDGVWENKWIAGGFRISKKEEKSLICYVTDFRSGHWKGLRIGFALHVGDDTITLNSKLLKEFSSVGFSIVDANHNNEQAFEKDLSRRNADFWMISDTPPIQISKSMKSIGSSEINELLNSARGCVRKCLEIKGETR